MTADHNPIIGWTHLDNVYRLARERLWLSDRLTDLQPWAAVQASA